MPALVVRFSAVIATARHRLAGIGDQAHQERASKESVHVSYKSRHNASPIATITTQ